MSAFDYRSARAMYPFRPDLWAQPEYVYDPMSLPVPADHPELPLFSDADAELDDGGTSSRVFTDPIPARMLNEFVYCPRLFYYEFVEGVFLESADTERGKAIHKKVDKGRGELPPAVAAVSQESGLRDSGDGLDFAEPQPPVDGESRSAAGGDVIKTDVIHSRSASLGSERLGVIAKMDLIEVQHITVEAAGEGGASIPLQAAAAIAQAADETGAAPVAKTGGKGGKRSRADMPQLDLFGAASAPANQQPEAAAKVAHAPTAMQGTVFLQKVTPVDYKVGAPRMGDDGAELWEADKMQLGLQMLILRDNGYACDEGVIYYRETRQRVPLQLTAELEQWVLEKIAEARQVAAARTLPLPLVNSPKCVRCSLAPVCLPDETRFMQEWPAELADGTGHAGAQQNRLGLPGRDRGRVNLGSLMPPRRLIAARDDSRALYLNSQGARVTLRSEVLVVKEEKTVLKEIRLKDLSHVALFGNIQITTQTVQMLCAAEIPVAYFSMGGWFYGLTRGHGLKNVFTRIEQFNTAQEPRRCLALAQRFVHGKVRNHRTQMMRNHTSLPEGVALKLKRAADDALAARSLDELLGIEGAAAALYFQHFPGLIKVNADDDDLPGLDSPSKPAEVEFTFDFTKRSRRPPADPVNALLSLAYSLLAKDCTLAALAVGFDPYIGFYHQPRHGRPALALDLMEEFRPLIAESAVLTAINNRMIHASHFVRAGEAVSLTQHGRKVFFQAYEQRMNSVITHPVFDYKASYRRVLELQARMLARYLTGEIPAYVPMMTR